MSATTPASDIGQRSTWPAFQKFVLWGGLILAVIVIYLHVQTAAQQGRIADELRAMAELKAGQITRWRNERFADARVLAHLPMLRDTMQAISHGEATDRERDELVGWLREFELTYNYHGVLVLNAAMEPLASPWNNPVLTIPALREQLHQSHGDGEVSELAPYVDSAGELRWDLLVPIRAAAGAPPIGTILLQTSPAGALWPVLQAWPGENKTGQFVLWYRTGNQLFALGGYRRTSDMSEAEQRPFGQVRDLTKPSLLLAQVANGERELVAGRDVRGIPVVGLGQKIPDSDWLLTCRVDASEVYAPVRRNTWQVVAIGAAIFGMLGLTVARNWRERQKDLLHERMAAELEQKRVTVRLGAVMQHARDTLFIVDPDFRIVDANERAVAMYGWSMAELLGKDVRELRTAASLPSLTADAARAMEPSGNNYEAEHRRKDGTRFPVEITSRSVELDGKPHYFSIVRDITVRQQLESEVRASEERYRLIAENTSDLIWLYEMAQEGFSYVSPSSLPLLGYRPEELRAQKLVTTLTAASAEKAMLIVREELAAIARSPKARSVTVELDQRHKDGRIVPTEVVVSFVADASGKNVRILGVTRDITERKRAREALQKFNTDLEQRVEQRTGELAARNHEIQALLNAIPDTVLLCNERGALISARSVKYPAVAGLVTGESLPNRLPLLDQAILKAIGELHASVAAKREIIVGEFEWAIGDEKTVFIEARATPVGAQRTLILLRDITDRKQHDRNVLANLEREKQLSAMKSQFVSVASHEFRTPLAAAVGSLELLERHAAKLTDTKRNELLTRIQRALGRLTAIMDDVLQLSRADSGRVQVKRMDIDLARFVQDIIHDVEMGDRQQHTFVFQPTGELQIVPVDPNLLNHILSNLLGNAVRYAPAGTKVSVKLEFDHEAFAITVADEGIGIPEAERGQIFEPFVRGSNVGQIAGTGLGLNIVKRYAELMGGTIGLLPSARGAVFHVRIPFQPPAAS